MKLYHHPISTTCRPIMLLAAADKIAVQYQLIVYSQLVAMCKDGTFEDL